MEKFYDDVREIKDFRELINQSVEFYGDKPAFVFKKRMYKKDEKLEFNQITYKEFKNEIDCFGTALNYLDIETKRVALISKNRYEWNVVYYGTTIDGKIIVPLDKALPDNEIISLAERSEAEVIVFEEKYMDIMKKIKDTNVSNIKKFICFDLEEDKDGFLSYKKILQKGKELLETGNRSYLDAKIDNEKLSVLLFTSGTTSKSKAVMLSQKNICTNVIDINKVIKFYSTDSMLALLPFHHAFQALINHVLFYVGASMCFCDGLRYIAQNLCEYKPTVIVCVPLILESIHKKMIKTIDKEGKTKLVSNMKKITNVLDKLHINVKEKVFKDIHNAVGGNVRLIVSGAASMDPALIKSYNEFGFKIYQGYGLTETSPVISVENDRYMKPGSVGRKLPSLDVKVNNPNEKGIGEILVKGPSVMLGYYKNNEATEEAFVDGWFNTGDLGYIEDGFIYITGRKKNVIVQKNGKNIFPEELELLISYIPGVKENMVYGKPTKDDDLDVCVKIVYDEEIIKDIMGYINEQDIHKYMKNKIAEINKKMPPYKHIRDIIVTNQELIKTTTAKVKRHEEISRILNSDNKS